MSSLTKWNNKVFIVFQSLTYSLNICQWNIVGVVLMNLLMLNKIITLIPQVKVEGMFNLNGVEWISQIQTIHP